jgi:phosphatidylglycerophosphate synthase
MPEEFCDCGSAIPENASFCPGCGKPLTVEAREADRQANAFPRPREGEEPTGPIVDVDFGTPGALRSCYWSAAFAAIFMNLPPLTLLFFIIYPAAGFHAVYSFRRRSQREVKVRAGAKLGFMTGVIAFALMLVLVAMATLSLDSDGLKLAFEESAVTLEADGQPEIAADIRELGENRSALAVIILFGLIIFFAISTGFTTVGGALGAKVLERD